MTPDRTSMDNTVDDVLKRARASAPNAAASGAALDALLAVVDSLDKPK